jgi:hypothetical protein
VPELPAGLRQAKASGCEIDLKHAIYFNARDAVVAKRTHNLAARARLLLRSASTGQFEVYNISNNNITNAANLGTVGLDFQVAGFGDFNRDG